MFAKPFRVKTQNAIKGSDRKKLRTELGTLYPMIPTKQLPELVPNKEEMSIAKVQCHNGQNILVYCLQKNPIFFDVEKIIYPTVYLLWKYPDLLPFVHTWPQVFPKIQGGADLMMPGICVKGEITPQSLGNLPKSTTCSIKLLGNNAPFAIGNTTMSSRDMIQEAGMKGKGVIIIHCYGDYMWEFGDRSDPPQLEEPFTMGLGVQGNEEESDDRSDQPGLSETATGENVNGTFDTSPQLGEVSGDTSGNPDGELTVDGLSLEEREPSAEWSEPEDGKSPQEQMDELLQWCFLAALKVSLKRSDLPILTSNFYRNHMLPCCPPGKSLDVKKSSFKKLSKFLNEMKNRGLVTLKQQKDMESITEFDKTHLDLRGLDTSEVNLTRKAGIKDETVAATPSVVPPNITEVHLVTANVLPLFESTGQRKGDALTASEVRNLIKQYAQKHQLDSKQSRGFVTLDPILADVVLNKGEYLETIRLDELTTRCLSKMTLAYWMVWNGQPPAIRKGKLEPVSLKVVTRSGNKKATLIEHLEVYGIDPQEFAHTVQKGVACSTSVNSLPGKNHGFQVMVQGDQTSYIANLLTEKYQLQRKWVVGAEKAGKGRKR